MEEIFYRQHCAVLHISERGRFHAKDTQNFFQTDCGGACRCNAGFRRAVSMTVSAASAKPVLDTDVTVPSAGNVLIGMEGTYANDIQAALKLVNQYRWEACSNGYPNPVNGKKLTKNDYVPMECLPDWNIWHGFVRQRVPRRLLTNAPMVPIVFRFRPQGATVPAVNALHGGAGIWI